MFCIVYVYLFADGDLDWFYTLTIVNKASVNMDVYGSVGYVDLGCSRYPGVLELDDRVVLFLVWLEISIWFSKVVITVYIPIVCHIVINKQTKNEFKHFWEEEGRYN